MAKLKHIFLIILSTILVGCMTEKRTKLCGVTVDGTPWSFAAKIYDEGDRTFIPKEVEYVSENKAYISGWLMPDEQPAQIVCDIEDGKVSNAILHTEN